MALPALAAALPALSSLLGGGGGSQSTANNSLNFSAALSPSISVVVQGEGGASSGSDVSGGAQSDAAASLSNPTSGTPLSGTLGTFSNILGDGSAVGATDAGLAYAATNGGSLFGSPLVIGGAGIGFLAFMYFMGRG